MSGLPFDRPLGLVGLLLPILFLVLCRRRGRPSVRYAANLGIWAAVLRDRVAPPERHRLRMTWAQGCAFGGLVLAALALAGPRSGGAAGQRTWTVVLDPRASMGLVDRDGETRLERGIAAAESWIDERLPEGDPVAWVRFTPEGEERSEGSRAPESWRSPRRVHGPLPSFRAWDRAGVLWVSDLSPDPEGRGTSAAWVAVGAEAVPGPVAVIPAPRDPDSPLEAPEESLPRYLEWDGVRWVEGETPVTRGTLVLGERLPDSLRFIAEAWAEDRGLGVTAAPGSSDAAFVALVIEGGSPAPKGGVNPPDPVTFQARLSGLRLEGRVDPRGLEALRGLRSSGFDALLEARIESSPGASPVIVGTPGRIATAVLGIEAFEGDSAEWPVFLGTQFDRYRLPDPELLPLADRSRAGPPGQGQGVPPDPEGAVPPRRWMAELATLAALLLLAAAVLEGSPGGSTTPGRP